MINGRIQALQEALKNDGYSAYILPLCDPHQSEYPAAHWKALPWLSGFTGSAGTVMVSLEHAGLWTDSRYFIQAETELADSAFVLHKMNMSRDPGYLDWLVANLDSGSKVVVDGPLISLAQQAKFESTLTAKDIELVIATDYIAQIWTSDRPPIPTEKVFSHDDALAGRTRSEKIGDIKKKMEEVKAHHHLISTLDDIAWTLNLRGRDVPCNPVFVSYLLISNDHTTLFIDPEKLPSEISKELEADNIILKPYTSIYDHLTSIPETETLLYHEATINVSLYKAIKNAKKKKGQLISRHLKAVKNKTELKHYDNAMIKDGVALTHAFKWLEETVQERSVTEYELAAKLAECRSQQELYYGESFDAIVGYEGNGAIIHYRPELDTCAEIKNNGVLLVDSGGQYHDGTTDITRCFVFSEPSDKYKNAYTRVLKGHIALAMAKFPKGTSGGQLDLLARHALWQDGLNYGHGTGHGVGFFMNVHEPPQSISPSSGGRAATVLKAGMVTSNEPGHYVTDEYGIRIENLIVAKEATDEGFLEFETITYFPIETRPIIKELMSTEEIIWFNKYQETVYKKLSPHLDAEAQAWLKRKCVHIS